MMYDGIVSKVKHKIETHRSGFPQWTSHSEMRLRSRKSVAQMAQMDTKADSNKKLEELIAKLKAEEKKLRAKKMV